MKKLLTNFFFFSSFLFIWNTFSIWFGVCISLNTMKKKNIQNVYVHYSRWTVFIKLKDWFFSSMSLLPWNSNFFLKFIRRSILFLYFLYFVAFYFNPRHKSSLFFFFYPFIFILLFFNLFYSAIVIYFNSCFLILLLVHQRPNRPKCTRIFCSFFFDVQDYVFVTLKCFTIYSR